MAIIAPFRAVRYNPARIPNMAEVVSPPYDVIGPEAQASLSAASPYNMIHLDLSKSVGSEQLDEKRYLKASNTFLAWLDEKILLREEAPCIYLYHTDYHLPSGQKMTRKGLLCLVQLAEFTDGIVKPHEKTFSGVTSDRLRLLDTCHTQFSPIFSLYPDPEGRVMALLEAVAPPEPLYVVPDRDGCLHKIWAVNDRQVLTQVAKLFQEKVLYIADGHHRYTTALQFRALMRERLGEIPTDSPYNHTMMYLCGMEDPGLSVLPTHRLVTLDDGTSSAGIMNTLEQDFHCSEVVEGHKASLVNRALTLMAAETGSATTFGLYHPKEERCFLLRLRDGVMQREFGASLPAALRELDVVVLSDLILGKLLALDHQRCETEGRIAYHSHPAEAIEAAIEASKGEGCPLLFLMNPTKVAQVQQVADQGMVMPHKSTYFYPKALTGLLLNRIVAEERVGE